MQHGVFLPSRNIILNIEEALCPFCRSEVETTDHLLLHCQLSWKLWAECMKRWNSEWVCPSNLKSLTIWWFKNNYRNVEKVCWEVIFLVVVRSIWKTRNELVFKEEMPNFSSLIDLIECRCAFWVLYVIILRSILSLIILDV